MRHWQRIKRRFSLWGGSYTHPDGYIELDSDEKAGISRHDTNEEADVKLRRYLARGAVRERNRARSFGAGLLGIGTYAVATHLGFEGLDAIGEALAIAVGAYFLAY